MSREEEWDSVRKDRHLTESSRKQFVKHLVGVLESVKRRTLVLVLLTSSSTRET
jgi:hypothetical protein